MRRATSPPGGRACLVVCLAWVAALGLGSPAPGTGQEIQIDGRAADTRADGPCFDNTLRYVGCVNGTATDTVTDLVWLLSASCAELPAVTATGTATWPVALTAAAALGDGICGLSDGSQPGDWRLPTRDEWTATIARAVELGCTEDGAGGPPSLTNQSGTGCIGVFSIFAGIQSLYWTGTLDEDSPNRAWYVDLDDGSVPSQLKNAFFAVWPVRDRR